MADTYPKIAVVTGSSSGIGRATALELARNGYSLVLHARRNLAGLQRTAADIRKQNSASTSPVMCLTADIACPRSCYDLVATAFGWQGRVDTWVNNAGADVLTGNARDLPFENRLRQLMEVDILGTIRISRWVAQRMQAQAARQPACSRPTIINMSWDQANLGMEGDPGQLFCTTKAAVAAFSTALALSAPGLRVNCVAPGWVQTDWGSTSASESWSRRAVAESLADRWGSAQDIAQVISWLASAESQFVNGQIIPVNGGRRFYPC